MESKILNKSYLLLENKNLISEEALEYLKSSNNYNLKKSNVFFNDIMFIHITEFCDKDHLLYKCKNNILNLSNTKINKDIALYLVPVVDNSLDDFIEELLHILELQNSVNYLEFIDFHKIPKYLFDIEILLKYNINLGSNIDIFNHI